MTAADIEQMIINDGYSTAVVCRMTNKELEQAMQYSDYSEYTRFMYYMCCKYDR